MSVIILDDRDANITRAGQWSDQGVAQEFLQTTSASGTQGSTLSVDFHGTGIWVYGTLGFGAQSTMDFSVDSGTSSTFTAPVAGPNAQFHQKLFALTSLADGQHTLVVTQQTTISPVANTNLFIDYFLVNVTGGGDILGHTTFFDDFDPDISYEGSWGNAGTDQDLQSTLHQGNEQGSTASLEFDGTAVTVYGNIKQNTTGQIASFSVDKASAFVFSATTPNFDLGVASNQQFFQATGLSPGNHTLVMTTVSAGTFFLDYVTVSGFTLPPPSSAGSSSGSHTSTATGTGSSPTTSPNTDVEPSQHSSDAGAIAGGIVGGLVAIAALVLFFLWYRRRQREDAISQFAPNPGSVIPGSQSLQPMMQQNNFAASSSFNGGPSGQYSAPSAGGYVGGQLAPNSNYSGSVNTTSVAGVGAGAQMAAGGAQYYQQYPPSGPASAVSHPISPTESHLTNPYSGLRHSPPASDSSSTGPYAAIGAAAMGVAVASSSSRSNRQLPATPGSGGGHSHALSNSTEQSTSTNPVVADRKRQLEWASPTPVVQHQDSGLRDLPEQVQQQQTVVEVPPEYTAI